MKSAIMNISITLFFLFSGTSIAFYEAFPSHDAQYISGPASPSLKWKGENFESYRNRQELECSSNKYTVSHIDITSGCLSSRYVGSWRRGWTDSSVFRAVSIGEDSYGRKLKWTDQTNEFRAYVKNWHDSGNIPGWSGIHAFARYRTSDDLYVASIRYDGLVTIKRKWNGIYTTLAQTQLNNEYRDYLDSNGKLSTGKWYKLKFSAIGRYLKFYLDGELLLSTTSETFSWGTTGIRIDNASTYLDDWKLLY